MADVTGDGVADLITGAGVNGNNRVRVYDGVTHHAIKGSLNNLVAFPNAQAKGVWVAGGDIDGDGKADVIVGTDGTAKSQVKVFSGATGQLLRTLDLSQLQITGGVRVASGDINADGKADIVVATSPGQISQVAAFDGGTGMLLTNYFPFGEGDRSGVNLAVGDVNGDYYSDIVAGQATGGSWVRVFSGRDTTTMWNQEAFPGTTTGVRVGTADMQGDGQPDVLVSTASTGNAVRVLSMGNNSTDDSDDLHPLGSNYNRGLFVAGDSRPQTNPNSPLAVEHAGPLTLSSFSVTGTDGLRGSTASFVITRSGDTSGSATMGYSWGGTATSVPLPKTLAA
jgi:hypothetical protein